VELKTPLVPASAANAATNLHKQTISRSQTLDFFFKILAYFGTVKV
jgi:hypothetical protein